MIHFYFLEVRKKCESTNYKTCTAGKFVVRKFVQNLWKTKRFLTHKPLSYPVWSGQRTVFKSKTAFNHQPIATQNETIEKDRGRIETRRCRDITNLLLLDEADKWLNSGSIIEIKRKRLIKGKQTEEIAYYISRLKQDAAFMNQAIRRHWSIENQCHWTLDVTFNEDQSRKRKKHQAENFSILRRIALNVEIAKPAVSCCWVPLLQKLSGTHQNRWQAGSPIKRSL